MPDIDDDPRTYFAEERTFLAWIRTGLGLMGVGFAVARFGLFLRELKQEQALPAVHSTGASVYAGVALVALGTVVNIGAVARHVRTINELKSHTWSSGRLSWSAILLALLLAIFGVGIGIYLLLLR
jgi:putative membrane protein